MKSTIIVLLLLYGLACSKVNCYAQKSINKPKQEVRKTGNSTNSGKSRRSKSQILQSLINNMVFVEGGTFMMGRTSEQGVWATNEDNLPVHQVVLSGYSIGKYEVTQEEWQTVMGNNPSINKNPKLPVGRVSWNDCQVFIRKLNRITGKNFRLPTEAEWEYAARGGNQSKGFKYAGSNDVESVAWFDENSKIRIHPVGTKAPNELGLYDMTGNVWEWCNDIYGNYTSDPQTNPTGASGGYCRVYRGGGYSSEPWALRVSTRGNGPATFKENRTDLMGLRLAL